MPTAILSKDGNPLMPTNNIRKVRKLLKTGKAEIVRYRPFAIRLLYDIQSPEIQATELKMDTGYANIGISVQSERHEFLSEERKMLPDEKKHHQKQKRYRNGRRNRLRYRKPQNKRTKCSRRKQKGWLAPSLEHKKDIHVSLVREYMKLFPITTITVEMGQFDTQALAAVNEGKPLPKGTDYQHGQKYGYDTLREAVFARDRYRCQCCKKSAIKDNVILVVHHIGFRKGDRSNRIGNLLTLCSKCHTPRNHKEGGKLWGIKPKTDNLAPPAFMNAVKWQIYEELKTLGVEVRITYGSKTKRERLSRNIGKSHANDAYCMGIFHAKHRTKTRYYKKRRRNNRCLERFYDAKYVDVRTGKKKKAAELGCNRTKRNIPRNNEKNERKYRGKKISPGRRSIRKQRYPTPSGSIILYQGKRYISGGNLHYGDYTKISGLPDVRTEEVTVLSLPSGWVEIDKETFYKKKGGSGKE